MVPGSHNLLFPLFVVSTVLAPSDIYRLVFFALYVLTWRYQEALHASLGPVLVGNTNGTAIASLELPAPAL